MHREIYAALAIWTACFIGQFLHCWFRASAVVASKLNGVVSYEQYVRQNAPALLIRYCLTTFFLVYWNWHPDTFTLMAKYFGWAIPLTVELNVVSAWGIGLCSDTILDLAASKSAI